MFYNNYKWSVTFENYESLHCTPETNIIFYSNYTSIKKIFFFNVFTVWGFWEDRMSYGYKVITWQAETCSFCWVFAAQTDID